MIFSKDRGDNPHSKPLPTELKDLTTGNVFRKVGKGKYLSYELTQGNKLQKAVEKLDSEFKELGEKLGENPIKIIYFVKRDKLEYKDESILQQLVGEN